MGPDVENERTNEAACAASALDDGLGGWCPRGELVVAIHDLASHFENALYAFRDDSEALLKAKRDIAWARNVAARHNHNGSGCRQTPNVKVTGAPRHEQEQE